MLKRETRILGLSAPARTFNKVRIVGAVFRGSLWLDGIISCEVRTDETDPLKDLIRAIVRSRQYSQIRTAILFETDLLSRLQTDLAEFSRRIDLPAISVQRKTFSRTKRSIRVKLPLTRLKTDRFLVKRSDRTLYVQAKGISREEVREVFAVACATGQKIPEALRVAEMIASQVTKSKGLAKQHVNA